MGGGQRGPATGGGGGGGSSTGSGGPGANSNPKTAGPKISTPMAVPRGASSKELLKLDWDYATFTPAPVAKSDDTAAKQVRSALSREDALRVVAGDDPRPILVLRECPVCNKTDDALLQPGADNERTILLARWFHCVKLPQDVVEPDHPFNALFPTNDSEHLFVAARSGANKQALESDTSRTELWSSMVKVLGESYSKDATVAYKEIQRAIDKLDVLDQRIVELEKKKSELMETPRVDPAKVRKAEDEIELVRRAVNEQKAEIKKISLLELKPAAGAGGVPAKAGR